MSVKVLDSSAYAQSGESLGFLSSRASMTPQNALSRVVARRAAEFDFVLRFRNEVLQNELVPFAKLPGWIRQRASDEQSAFGKWASKQRNYSADCLLWLPPGAVSVDKVPVLPGGILDGARLAAAELARTLLWSEPQAVVFLLCGEIPIVPACITRTSTCDFPALARVTLDVHLSLSPSDVRTIYRRVQHVLMGERKRQRNMTTKHLTLAAFAAENKNGTYRDLKRLWNREHRRWKYLGSDEHFAKDCKRAQDKLLMKGPGPRASLNLGRL